MGDLDETKSTLTRDVNETKSTLTRDVNETKSMNETKSTLTRDVNDVDLPNLTFNLSLREEERWRKNHFFFLTSKRPLLMLPGHNCRQNPE